MSDGYEYFASPTDVPTEDIGTKLMGRLEQLMAADFGKERRQKWAQAYRHRYGFDFGAGSTSEVLRGGEQGELSQVRVNNSTTTQQALLGLLLSPKFNWRPIARNGTVGARAAQSLAVNVLEYYWRVRRMARHVAKWADKGIRYGESFVFAQWDETQGPEVMPDGPEAAPVIPDLAASATQPPTPGQPSPTPAPLPGVATPTQPPRMLHDGDFRFWVVSPWDHFTDEEATDGEHPQWHCVRLWLPRADVEAQWPQTVTGEETSGVISAQTPHSKPSMLNMGVATKRDRIPVWFFFHDKSPAVPEGRETVLVNAKCVLADGPLTYRRNPVVRFAPEEQDDSVHGYTVNFDQLGVQDVIDGLETAVATNQLTMAVQSIVIEEGTKASPDETHGMRVFTKRPGAESPTALQLTSTPKEVFENLNRLPGRQRDMMGMNDVSMGQPETAQMNAEAFALLASMATQRNSPKQQALLDSVGELGSLLLGELAHRVSMERFIAVAGKGSITHYQEGSFTGDKLEGIEQVMVDVGNPLEQSVAGRFQLAQLYVQSGVRMTPDDVTQVVETGRLDVAINPLRDLALLIQHENEELSEGRQVPVSIMDDAVEHCRKHASVLTDPQTRGDPGAVKCVQEHIDEHYVNFYGLQAPVGPDGVPLVGPDGKPMKADPKADPMYSTRIRLLLGQTPPQALGPPAGPAGTPPPGADPSAMLTPPTGPGVTNTENPQTGAPAGPPM